MKNLLRHIYFLNGHDISVSGKSVRLMFGYFPLITDCEKECVTVIQCQNNHCISGFGSLGVDLVAQSKDRLLFNGLMMNLG